MLWKDFKEKEDCYGCPLLEHEMCTGGYQCYGGEPIEPPCCNFDDDTDLDKWVDDTKCRCSNCDIIALIGLYPHGDKNYCPNCGAKMDGDKEG